MSDVKFQFNAVYNDSQRCFRNVSRSFVDEDEFAIHEHALAQLVEYCNGLTLEAAKGRPAPELIRNDPESIKLKTETIFKQVARHLLGEEHGEDADTIV